MKILKQYKNLIALVAAVILVIGIIASDPLGIIAKRKYERAAIRNQIAIEQAQTQKRITVIRAEQEAEMIRIYQSLGDVDAEDMIGAHSENK